jgi:PKHD-type hydroxylase
VLVQISSVLTANQLLEAQRQLEQVEWDDGTGTAGYLSRGVKNNNQLLDSNPIARNIGDQILSQLENNALFTSASLPLKIMSPIINRYTVGQSYGPHIDGAIRTADDNQQRIRTDLSATLFLSEPEDYDGGELVVEDTYGTHSVKRSAGDIVLYPATSVHRVEPVTRGTRLAAFFWVQSMVRDHSNRTILFQLDSAIQRVASDVPEHEALVSLAGVYHNLLRFWADT